MKSRFASLVGVAVFSCSALAQNYPTKPIRWIVPDGPGGSSDIRARQIGAKVAEFLGQPVVIDNRPGGNMFIGTVAAARSPGDGYTMFIGNMITHVHNPLLFRSLPYRPDEDFIPVTMITAGPPILAVNPQVPAKSLTELVELARSRPEQLHYASLGRGTVAHLVMEQIIAATGVRIVHVPYKSTGTTIQDLLAGHIPITVSFWSVLAPHVKSGKIRALAVAGPRRLVAAPDLPTFAEAGMPGIEANSWSGLFAPAGTPKAIVGRLHAEIVRTLNVPEIRNNIIENGGELGGNSPEEFAAYIQVERARLKKVIEAAGITPE